MEVILTCDLAMPTTRGGRPPGKAQVCREAGLRLHDLSFARSVVQGLAPTVAAQRYLPDSLVDERVASAHLRHVLQIAVDILGGIAEQTAVRHLFNASKKLDCVNKHQAVLKALRLKLIW